jgi:hypothetical protein
LKKLLLIPFLFVAIFLSAQPTVYEKSLHSDAENMVRSLLEKNYEKFANYIYPGIIKIGGGKDKLIAATKKSYEDMAKDGFSIADVTLGEFSTILKSGTTLQAVIEEKLKIKFKQGHMVSKSYLIAVSEDGGKTWTFIDTSNKTLEQVRQLFPLVSTKLVIPKKEDPLFYGN